MNPNKFFDKSILAKLTFAILLSTFGFSSVVLADHEEEFIAALEAKKYDKAARIFHENKDTIDPAFVVQSGEHQGASLLWLLAEHKQWYLIKRLLKTLAHADINSSFNGATVLSLAVLAAQWPLINRMLDLNANPQIDVQVNRQTVLGNVVALKQTALALRMLQLHPSANVDVPDANGLTALYIAVYLRQWELVKRMLDLNLRANVNAGPSANINGGPVRLMVRRGDTALLRCALELNWELVERMLHRNHSPNVNAFLIEGRNAGVTVLLIALQHSKWQIAEYILANHLNVDLDTVRQAGAESLRNLIARSPSHVQKALVLHEIRRAQLEDIAMDAELGIQLRSTPIGQNLFATFRRVAAAFPQFETPHLVEEHSNLERLPRDLRWLTALMTLREEDPELKNVPDFVLKDVFMRFQAAFKMEDYNGRRLDAVEAGVMARICPVDNRDGRAIAECNAAEAKTLTTKRKRIKTIRTWIRDAITNAGLTATGLDRDTRARLVRAIAQWSLSKITRARVRATVDAFIAERTNSDSEPVSALKRERDEEEVQDVSSLRIRIKLSRPDGDAAAAAAPNGNIREGLVRDVIRDAPGLEMADVRARVDEMMLGEEPAQPDPMDIEDDAPANSNADYIGDDDGLDPYALTLDALLHGAIPQTPFFGEFGGSGQL